MKNRLEDYRNGYHPWIVSGVLRFIDNTRRTTRWCLNVTGWKTKRSIPRALPGSFLIKCDSLDVLNTTRHEIIETNFQFVRYPSEILDFFTNLYEYLFSVFLQFPENIPIRKSLIYIFNIYLINRTRYQKRNISNNIQSNYHVITVLLEKIILVEALKKCFCRVSNILGIIIIRILEVSPPVRKPHSLPILKSSSSRCTALIRMSRDEIMQNLSAQWCNDLHFGEKIQGAGQGRRIEEQEWIARRDCGHGIFRGRPLDLHRCGQPDTPNSLSRSNLIGRPQHLYDRPCVETRTMCVRHAWDKPSKCSNSRASLLSQSSILAASSFIPPPLPSLSLSLSFSLHDIYIYIYLCPTHTQLPDSLTR